MQQASLGAAPRPRIGREQLLRADFPQAQYRGLLPLNARLLTCRHVERLRLGRSENPSGAIHNAIVVTLIRGERQFPDEPITRVL